MTSILVFGEDNAHTFLNISENLILSIKTTLLK